MQQTEIRSLIQQHGLWLESKGIQGKQLILNDEDLTHMTLGATNFNFAILKNCKFIRTNLSKSTFIGADVSGANFAYCELSEANFNEAQMVGTLFEGVRMGCALIQNTTLKNVTFSHAFLKESNFSGTSIDGVNYEYANLFSVDFSDSNILEVNFKNSLQAGTKLPINTSISSYDINDESVEDVPKIYAQVMKQIQRPTSKLYQHINFFTTNVLAPLGMLLVLIGMFGLVVDWFFSDNLLLTKVLWALLSVGGVTLGLTIAMHLLFYIMRKTKFSYLPNLNLNLDSVKVDGSQLKDVNHG